MTNLFIGCWFTSHKNSKSENQFGTNGNKGFSRVEQVFVASLSDNLEKS